VEAEKAAERTGARRVKWKQLKLEIDMAKKLCANCSFVNIVFFKL